jgi:hypothetical protein
MKMKQIKEDIGSDDQSISSDSEEEKKENN